MNDNSNVYFDGFHNDISADKTKSKRIETPLISTIVRVMSKHSDRIYNCFMLWSAAAVTCLDELCGKNDKIAKIDRFCGKNSSCRFTRVNRSIKSSLIITNASKWKNITAISNWIFKHRQIVLYHLSSNPCQKKKITLSPKRNNVGCSILGR